MGNELTLNRCFMSSNYVNAAIKVWKKQKKNKLKRQNMQNFTLVGVGGTQPTSQMLLRLHSQASMLPKAAAACLTSARLLYVMWM